MLSFESFFVVGYECFWMINYLDRLRSEINLFVLFPN
jgi:hypothetical protein